VRIYRVGRGRAGGAGLGPAGPGGGKPVNAPDRLRPGAKPSFSRGRRTFSSRACASFASTTDFREEALDRAQNGVRASRDI